MINIFFEEVFAKGHSREWNFHEIWRFWLEHYPSIFYIGMEKTASQSLVEGLIKNKTTHWHDEDHFEEIHKERVDCLLDIVDYVAEKSAQKPLVIDCIREPISRQLSYIFQYIFMERYLLNTPEDIIKKLKQRLSLPQKPYALNWKRYGVDILTEFIPEKHFFYKECDTVKLLFLRFEDSNERKNIFTNLGYEFEEVYINATTERPQANLYLNIKNNLHFSSQELDKIYDDINVKSFYTVEEIQTFKQKYLK